MSETFHVSGLNLKPEYYAVLLCKVPECPSDAKTKGMCDKHYRRMLRNGTLETKIGQHKVCKIDSCDQPARARGYCENHYRKFLKYGDALAGPGRGDWGHGSYRHTD